MPVKKKIVIVFVGIALLLITVGVVFYNFKDYPVETERYEALNDETDHIQAFGSSAQITLDKIDDTLDDLDALDEDEEEESPDSVWYYVGWDEANEEIQSEETNSSESNTSNETASV